MARTMMTTGRGLAMLARADLTHDAAAVEDRPAWRVMTPAMLTCPRC